MGGDSISLDSAAVQRIVGIALAEDIPWGDLTTDSLVPPSQRSTAELTAKEAGVLAGIAVATLVFATVDSGLQVEAVAPDGARLVPGTVIGVVRGPVAGMLRAERVALNFLQRLSGIATTTAAYAAAVEGTHSRIVDTRKTTPGLRLLEKYAVRVGGGVNHRFCLSDGVLIKDNHLAALRADGRTLSDAVALARVRAPHTARIEVEAETLADVEEALAAGADAILLDNMTVAELQQAVGVIGGRAISEASGGITLATVRAVADTGVDLISVGALTHSVKALDISLDMVA